MNKENLWIPWSKELAKKIMYNGKENFIIKTKLVDWRSDGKREQLLRYGDENIDPFSFFYLLAYKLSNSIDWQIVHDSVCNHFGLATSLSAQEYVIPARSMNMNILFHNGETFNPDALWNLFEEAAKDDPDIDANMFEEVLNIPQVGVTKLTQTLFFINPYKFLPIDEKVNVIPDNLIRGRFRQLEGEINDGGYENYKEIVNEIKDSFPECDLYEINLFLYFQSLNQPLVGENSYFFQVSTIVSNDKDQKDNWNLGDDDSEEASFEENSFVYVDTPPTDQPHLVTEPKRGDIVLVNYGQNDGRGIGVVLDNEYRDRGGFFEDCRIHTVWINKQSCQLNGNASNLAISQTELGSTTYSAFRRTAGYKNSFELIHSLLGLNEVSTNFQLNTIFFGPPGTGKTFTTTKASVEICCGVNFVKISEYDEIRKKFEDLRGQYRIKFVTFHQSYSYEEFVEGLRPEHEKGSGGFSLKPKDGVLKRIASEAKKNPNDNYVLIIDEINRANISKVFGELITLLEEDKREEEENEVIVELPYSNKPFSLPKNLYILGTMNTADRSIALIDTALRRRFEFIEISPDSNRVEVDVGGLKLREVFDTINARLEWFLDRDHLIGHAWFHDVKSRKDVDHKMCRKIIPLIAEYFHDDWNKVYSVVGGGFIERRSLKPPPQLIEESWEEERYSWHLRDENKISEDAYETLLDKKGAVTQVNQDESDN